MTNALRILLVEDSREDMILIDRVLRRAGLNIHCTRVERLEELSKLLEQEWDLLISDYHLRGFTAKSILQVIRSQSPDLPVIVMSGELGEEAAVEMMRAGASDYLVKGNLDRLPLIVEREVQESEERKRRRNAESRLRASEEMLSLFLNEVKEYAVFMMDPAGIILSWNAGAERITGFKENDTKGRHFELIFNSDDRSAGVPQEELRKARETGSASDDRWHLRHDGSFFWATGTVTPLKNDDGTIRGFAKIIRDTTVNKLDDELRQRQQAWLESALNLIPVPIFFADAESGQVRFYNHAFERQTGVRGTLTSPIPKGHHLLNAHGRELTFKDLTAQGSDRGKILDAQEFVWESPSQRFDILLSMHLLPEMYGHARTVVASFTDITHLKKIESELIQASSAKSQFLANMSHEIRTPLGAILGFTDLMREPDITAEELNQFGELVARNGKLLLQLINDILDLSKVEAGHLQVEYVPVALQDILIEVAAIIRPLAEQKKLQVIVTPPSDKMLTEILSDSTRLKQILLNLAGNAVKFTHSGSIVLSLHQSICPDTLTTWIGFKVQDTGIGISKEKQKNLFQPFSQADASMTRRYGGTGLGLVLSRTIARALGGDLILLESEEGKGSTFLALFNSAACATKPISPRPRPSSTNDSLLPTLSPNPTPPPLLKGLRILVVEDAPDNQLLMDKYLRTEGATPTFCDNGKTAIEKVTTLNFDIVLMDIQLPILDGHSATREIRRLGVKTPIIALTAHALVEEQRKCFEAGCNAYVTKPVAKQTLITEIRKLVS